MFLASDIVSDRAPDDDFWYAPVGLPVAAGVRVSSHTAMCLAIIYASVKIISESLGMLPLILYQRKDTARERATFHPLYNVLHNAPNNWQTRMQWIEMMQGHVLLRGNAYSEKIFGNSGFVEQLIPLHPDRVKVKVTSDTNWAYEVVDRMGKARIVLRDEMFHLRGLTTDGILGMNPIEAERQTIGTTIAMQDYAGRFYANDARPGGIIEYPGKFEDEEAIRKFRAAFQNAQTGSNRHKTAILERGMTYKEIKLSNKDAQFIDSRKYQDIDIARIFRIPPHKLGILDKASFSNIEQQAIEFVTDTLLPWITRWEQEIQRSILHDDNQFYAEFLPDALLRGDTKSRYEAYNIGITAGFLTRNEARTKENMNPKPGLDEPLQQLNMTTPSRAQALLEVSAQRVLNKELSTLNKAYQRTKPDNKAFDEAVAEFFEGHAKYVSKTLSISSSAANSYTKHCQSVLGEAVRVEVKTGQPAVIALLDEWDKNKLTELMELV